MATDTTGLPPGATRGGVTDGFTGDVTRDVTGGLTVTRMGPGADLGATGDLTVLPSGPTMGDVTGDVTRLPPDATFGDITGGVTRLPPGAEMGATGGLTVTRAGTGAETGATSPEAPPQAITGPLKVGQSLGPRYLIIKLLGVGGMGAVYQAWDAELSVAVALKVIRVDCRRGSASPEAEKRFKNELLLARQVTHKNVVRIHDLGEIDGIKYITMPYVQGDDLKTVLHRDGKLPIARALRLARQIAAGLDAAHEAGVVHRDLKPPNIMIGGAGDEEQALIMDFGISASTEEAASGGVVGTLEYMAPEQGTGEVVDARADIYAFGLILYEMLVGPRPAPSGTAQDRIEAMKQRFEQGLPSARTLDGSIPIALDAFVTCCLERDPAARFQTTAELAADLDRLDASGELLPVRRVVGLPVVSAGIALAVMLLAGTWWYASRPPPPARAPLPVLIANFDNRANDPLFEGTLEQNLGIGIEQASFITAYPHRDALRVAAEMKVGNTLDESVARLVATREGIKVVLSGSIEPRGPGYTVTVKAQQPDGKIISNQTATASSKNDVLRVVGSLASRMRRDLGDTALPKPGETEMFTTASLEAARLFYQAREFSDGYKNEDAIQYYKRAIEIDPNLGRAYAGWANGAFRLGRLEESRDVWKKALSLVDRMTDREKYRTLGLYYGTASRNYDKAIENYSALVKLYPADGAGHNNLALAYLNTMNPQKALEEGRRVLEIYPKNLLYLGNHALFAMYASDFGTAATEARRLLEQNPTYYPAYLPLAVAAIARADSAAVRDAYDRMAKAGIAGASAANLGLADWATYEGRFGEAVSGLKPGIAADEKRQDNAGMIAKYTALAEAYESDGKASLALSAAANAIKLAGADPSAVLPARVLIRLGKTREAAAVAAELGAQLQPESRAYGKILEAEIALDQRRMVDAIEAFRAAQKLADSWLGRFGLGVAYVQAGQYPEALQELELCQKRRGEAAAIFFDELPSFRYLAPLPYWLGRTKEELGMKPAATEHYNAFLALRSNSPKDPLVVDARKRVASL